MGITELRVGNIITSKSAKSLFEVTVSDFEHINHYLPVEITDELLFAFGFYNTFCKDIFEIKGFLLSKEDDGSFTTPLGIELKYVHKLQNLYFELTNKELTL